MIQRASFCNFKSLESVDLDFERLTVFVGPNGSGKTSVLQAFELFFESILRACRVSNHVELHPLVNHVTALLNKKAQESNIRLNCNIDDERVECQFKVLPPFSDDSLRLFFGSESNEWFASKNTPVFKALIEKEYRKPFLTRFQTADLANPSYSDTLPPRLSEQGKGLPSVLSYMALKEPEQFQNLQDQLRQVIPNVSRIRFDRARVEREEYEDGGFHNGNVMRIRKIREYVGDSLIFDYQGAMDVPAVHASEGTLLVTGILSAIFGPTKPNLLLLDDIERGLHPKAQRELIAMLRRLLAERPELQIIATSHSPYLLDDLKPEEVRLSILDENGASHFGKLSDHPEYYRWKDEMSPGEMWGMWGEKFLLERKAAETTTIAVEERGEVLV